MDGSLLGQLLLLGVPGAELTLETARTLEKVQPGGFILFGRNIRTALQLRKLIDDLRGLSRIEPIITIDQEGGRVSRLKLLGHEPPNAQQLREKGDAGLVRRHGQLTGALLRLFGFNLDLCPVLDICFDETADNSLRGRCYGATPEEVVRNATLFHDGLAEFGVRGCGKHFPGYAGAELDPHHDLPRVERSRPELEQNELAVFRRFTPVLASMMVGHAWYPCFDAERIPASLSTRVIQDLLQNELGFSGLILTDDLDMGAIVKEFGFKEGVRRAIDAGNHLTMVCHRVELATEAREALLSCRPPSIERALTAVHAFKKNLTQPDRFSEKRFAELDRQVRELRSAVLGADRADQHSPEDGKRSPVELY